MISVEQAIETIIQHAGHQPTINAPLEQAIGHALAQTVVADIDSPPFDKSLMDGYAVRAADLPAGVGTLTKIGEILAGKPSTLTLAPGQAIQIMTGAPIPSGADCVVMVERTTADQNQIQIRDPELSRGQNIMPRATEFALGDPLLHPGHRITSAEAGLLASVGATRVDIYRPPTIAILSTGDEIVPPDQFPLASQIRNSNAYTLMAAAKLSAAQPRPLGIAADDPTDLAEKIQQGLDADILLLSGGVSAGKRDLVPQTLRSLGVQPHFHGVAFKPGKPLWFGSHERGLVFGLPGNPVSVLACFEVFVKTALRARQSHPQPRPVPSILPLSEVFQYSTRRPTYHPARIESSATGPHVRPLSWQGSPDLRALAGSNALLIVPAGDGPYPPGTLFEVLPIHQD